MSLSGVIRELHMQVVTDIVQRHQAARAHVTNDVVDAFMAVRPMPNLFG